MNNQPDIAVLLASLVGRDIDPDNSNRLTQVVESNSQLLEAIRDDFLKSGNPQLATKIDRLISNFHPACRSPVVFGKDGLMKWQRVNPPILWDAAKLLIVADRHLPDGTRQHMVKGSVAAGLVINNAQVIGEDDAPEAEFSTNQSHLSQ